MSGNPSRFQSPDRPVEQVSWGDVQDFLLRILEKCPSLSLSLPTEAQWEYACRAGTESAVYTGPIEIIGERNAPALDPIAWYGGNSGDGYELEEGEYVSDWPEMQHPNSRAGTRPVGLKMPNAWGLYDMLGNVREWCADGWRLYDEHYQRDPVGPAETDPIRVIRGGSWDSVARYCRAAFRDGGNPDSRNVILGFRCVQAQA
jgi:formylglycine-generating enzyme required for sulfatase activity